MTRSSISTAAIAAILAFGPGLSACDNGPSAVETRDRTGETATATLTGATAETPVAERAALTVSRRETVDAKIERLYARNGADFGARSPEEFVIKIRAFTDSPPAGVETIKRPNGDTLYYQASTNTFAVVSRDGTPRTMFKPDDGAAYWAEQKDRAPTFGQNRTEPEKAS